jgi:predicted phosphodiesterase
MTTRVAIFSDVHGNLAALQAVLADIRAQERQPDQVIFAGDLCLFGPRPAECLQAVFEADFGVLYGNTDRWLESPPLLSDDVAEEELERHKRLTHIIEWTQAQLSVGHLALLNNMPFSRRISPDPNPRADLLVVHANPLDVDQVIYPPEDLQEHLFGGIQQSDDELGALMGDAIFGALAFGHLHVPNVRPFGDRLLVNVSSVSLPRDGDPRAKYAFLDWSDEAGWSAEHHFVAYPVDEEIAAFEERQPPGWEQAVARLREQGMQPQGG